MKRIYILTIYTFLLLAAYGQSGFPYQAIFRNDVGAAVGNQSIKVRFSLHQTTADGVLVYQEEHQATTNSDGLFTLEIGKGNTLNGSFEAIDWSLPYFIKTEADHGSGYQITGIQELLNTPYAQHAGTAGGLRKTLPDGKTYQLVVDDLGHIQTIEIPKGFNRLIFQDEFNGMGLPDPTKWGYEKGFVRNGEMQYYTVARPENAFQQDGILTIRCINNDILKDETGKILNEYTHSSTGKKYYITSASITTKDKAPWMYGKVEVKVKLPAGSGVWPAIWMLSQDRKYNNGISWPDNGEIDILEYIGNEPNKFHCAMHRYGANATSKGNSTTTTTATTEWHIFSLEWYEDRMEWYVDNKLVFRFKNPNTNWGDWPFDQRFYLLLNFAFGGGWGGRDGFNADLLPLDYKIDYVRIFQ